MGPDKRPGSGQETSTIMANGGPKHDSTHIDDVSGAAADQLRAFVERIERLEEEKKAIADDIKDVYAEAKGTGFDAKILRKIVSLRKKDVAERQEEEAILDLYMKALGMLDEDGTSRTLRAAE